MITFLIIYNKQNSLFYAIKNGFLLCHHKYIEFLSLIPVNATYRQLG